MRLLPRSIHGRLLALSTLAMIIALLVSAIAIGNVLERFVTGTFDERLGDKLAVLATAVKPDGTIDRAAVARFDTTLAPDQDWRIDAPRGIAGSARLGGDRTVSFAGGQALPSPADMAVRGPRPDHGRGERETLPGPPAPPALDPATHPFDIRRLDGDAMHGRVTTISTAAGDATIAVALPRETIRRPVLAALTPLVLSLVILGIALAAATVVQLRVGLRPLRALRQAIGEVRSGARRRLPDDQPDELVGTVAEVNALIAQNEEQLDQARRHVSNLAHGIKTPLAALAVRLAESDADPSLTVMIDQIDRRVRHHLGRARAATPAGSARARTMLAPAVGDLLSVLRRIHAERPLATEAVIPDTLAIAVDPQDLDEMLGNLLDNAWRFARTTIAVRAEMQGASVFIGIEDDGDGLDDAALVDVLAPGLRLDERSDGHGFGLSIVRELAELNGGRFVLARSDRAGWGLHAILTLPLAR